MKEEERIKGLEEEVELAIIRLRNEKKKQSVEQLKKAMEKIDSATLDDIDQVYRACINYIAQHRVLFRRLKLR